MIIHRMKIRTTNTRYNHVVGLLASMSSTFQDQPTIGVDIYDTYLLCVFSYLQIGTSDGLSSSLDLLGTPASNIATYIMLPQAARFQSYSLLSHSQPGSSCAFMLAFLGYSWLLSMHTF